MTEPLYGGCTAEYLRELCTTRKGDSLPIRIILDLLDAIEVRDTIIAGLSADVARLVEENDRARGFIASTFGEWK